MLKFIIRNEKIIKVIGHTLTVAGTIGIYKNIYENYKENKHVK